MNELRDMVQGEAKWNEDEWIATLPVPDRSSFLVLSWYKFRGATPEAFLLDSDGRCDLTLDVAEAIIAARSGEDH